MKAGESAIIDRWVVTLIVCTMINLSIAICYGSWTKIVVMIPICCIIGIVALLSCRDWLQNYNLLELVGWASMFTLLTFVIQAILIVIEWKILTT